MYVNLRDLELILDLFVFTMGDNETTKEDPKSVEATAQGDPEKAPSPTKPPKSKVTNSKRKSSAWDHFTKVEGGDPEKPRASCNYCGVTYACDPKSNGTKNMLHHTPLCKKYPYNTEDKKQKTLCFESKQEGGANLTAITFSAQACREALTKMIIIDELPFKFVENEGFRLFMGVAQPRLVIPSRTTIARDCLKLYLEEKRKLKSVMRGRRICITTDTWTSIQNINYMCLTAHFIDDEWKLHKRILNFCQVQSHKGEVLGKVVESCLIEWGVDTIYTITVDNASSNNGTVNYLKKRTKNWKGTIVEHDYLHVRCCAHVLNLIVSDGLKDLDDSIVKVRNSVRYVKSSPARLTSFKTCVDKEKIESKSLLCLDVKTRWNSTYMMLEAAGKFEKAFERMEEDDLNYFSYFRDDEEGEGRKILGPPEPIDWEKVKTFVKFLKIFYNATLRFSGSLHVTSNAFFHELVLIHNKLMQLRKDDDYFISSMAESMLKKFDKYWNIEKVNLLLFVAVVLDPRYKLVYVSFWFGRLYDNGNMAKEMSRKVKDALLRLYEWYDDHNPTSVSPQKVNEPSNVGGLNDDDDEEGLAYLNSQFKRHLESENNIGAKSEVERFLGESCEVVDNKFDVLDWWKNNASKYRILSRVARDIFAIPVSTVASESAFSTGGRVLDPFRSSLSPNTV